MLEQEILQLRNDAEIKERKLKDTEELLNELTKRLKLTEKDLAVQKSLVQQANKAGAKQPNSGEESSNKDFDRVMNKLREALEKKKSQQDPIEVFYLPLRQ